MAPKQSILIRFGDKVRNLRKEKGFSQEELAFKAELHRTYIGMIERAEKNISSCSQNKIQVILPQKDGAKNQGCQVDAG